MAADDSEKAIQGADRAILRDLAKRTRDIAMQPVMAERVALWKRHNALKPCRPMILIFPEGSWRELLPPSSLRCQGERARSIEMELRQRIYTCEGFDCDNVVTAEWLVGPSIVSTGWGVEAEWHFSDEATGARAFSPVIHEPADLKKLRWPQVSVDEEKTAANLVRAQELFGDILDVRRVGIKHFSYHLMSHWTSLRGLEQTMMDMVENPPFLHDAMAFLAEGHKRILRQYIELNLLDVNNDNTYHSSGGNGWTDELPAAGFDPRRVRPADVWASAEAQELALVSPAMHAEFALKYEKELLAPFGLNGYGCCEDLTRKLDDVLTIPNIRRISVSPFADVAACAAKIGRKAIVSWKPHPSLVAGDYNPQRIRDQIHHALDVARGCTLEMILKDTHTCENQPQRFAVWSRIAREQVDSLTG
jgi:hypothetical protein